MRFINLALVFLFVLTTVVGCSSTDSGTDLLNQAITPTKSSTSVVAASPTTPTIHVEDNSELIDDSLPPTEQIAPVSGNKPQLQVVKVSTPAIVPLKTSTIAKTTNDNVAIKTIVPPVQLIAESHQYTVIKVGNKAVPTSPQVWKIYLNDKVISNTLERWAEEGGYQLVWKSQHDFEITSEATITGNMRDAFNQVLLSFVDTSSPIKATWYKNKVIVITSFGE